MEMRHTYKINRWYTHRIFSSRIILLIMYCRGHYKNSFSFPAHTSVKVGDQKHVGWYREATWAALKSLQAICRVCARKSVGLSLSSKSLSPFGSPRKWAQRRSVNWTFTGWCPQVQHLWRKWQKQDWAEGRVGLWFRSWDWLLELSQAGSVAVPGWIFGPSPPCLMRHWFLVSEC